VTEIVAVTGASADGLVTVFVASRGSSRVDGWTVDGQSRRLELAHTEPVVALTCRVIAGQLWVAAAGESSVRLWQLAPDLSVTRTLGVIAPQLDVEHLVLLTGDAGVPFVSTAGPESLHVWIIDDDRMSEVYNGPDEPVVDVAVHHWPGGGFTLLVGTDDGVVHILESSGYAELRSRTLSHDLPITSVTMAVTGGDRYAVVCIDSSAQLASWALKRRGHEGLPGDVAQVPWMSSAAIGTSGPDGPTVLTTTDDGRILIWDVSENAALMPVGHERAPSGKLLSIAAHDHVAIVYTSGSILFAGPNGPQFTIAELNLNPSAFGHVDGRDWLLGAYERTVVAFDPNKMGGHLS